MGPLGPIFLFDKCLRYANIDRSDLRGSDMRPRVTRCTPEQLTEIALQDAARDEKQAEQLQRNLQYGWRVTKTVNRVGTDMKTRTLIFIQLTDKIKGTTTIQAILPGGRVERNRNGKTLKVPAGWENP
jgi:hypothetical protein